MAGLRSTVGVCGFGRCGSTMVMAMLDAGGLPPVEGSSARGYELPDLQSALAARPEALVGHAVKLLDGILHHDLSREPDWSFVWIDRNFHQQARSMWKFLRAATGLPLPEDAVPVLAASFRSDRPKALGLLRDYGPVTVLRYERVLADPLAGARELRRAFPGLDVEAAAAVVHDRTPACRPDLAAERGA